MAVKVAINGLAVSAVWHSDRCLALRLVVAINDLTNQQC